MKRLLYIGGASAAGCLAYAQRSSIKTWYDGNKGEQQAWAEEKFNIRKQRHNVIRDVYQANAFLKNEDRNETVIPNEREAFIGVYDGHSGKDCSVFLRTYLIHQFRYHLHQLEVMQMKYTQNPQHIREKLMGNPEKWETPLLKNLFDINNYVPKLLTLSFDVVDKVFIKDGESSNDAKALRAGAVGVLAYIVDNKIFVANTGDALALLCRQNDKGAFEAKMLSVEHRADLDEQEVRKRFPHDPEIVKNGRIKGMLQPSRAFGDVLFKKAYCHPLRNEIAVLKENYFKIWEPPYIINTPAISQHQIEFGKDKYLVVGSDGLFDDFTTRDILQTLQYYDEHPEVRSIHANPAQFLLHQLLKSTNNKPNDDITIVVVQFNDEEIDRSHIPYYGYQIPFPQQVQYQRKLFSLLNE